LIVALVIALAWLPVLIKFFRSWRERTNPVSLAICVLVGSSIYLPVYAALLLPASWPLATFLAVDGLACSSFYAAFWWTRKRFHDSRSDSRN